MSKESIQGPLSALRNAGTVCGVCLSRGSEVLVNLFPYSEDRINAVVHAIEEVRTSYQEKGKSIDQMSLGFDGGCLCLVEDGEFRLMVMHMLPDEVDFISKAARAFLADFQLGFFAEQIAAGDPRLLAAEAEEEASDESVAETGDSEPEDQAESDEASEIAPPSEVKIPESEA